MTFCQMVANHTVWACGCTTWLTWDGAAWIPGHSKHWQCRLHEEDQP